LNPGHSLNTAPVLLPKTGPIPLAETISALQTISSFPNYFQPFPERIETGTARNSTSHGEKTKTEKGAEGS